MKKVAFLILLTFVSLIHAVEPLEVLKLDKGILNNPGGIHGVLTHEGGVIQVNVNLEEDKTYSLELQYNVSNERQDSGYWFAVQHLDMRPYDTVRFKVKGLSGGENMKFGLKDDRWYEDRLSIDKYLQEPLARQWQTVEIPLADFHAVRQWDSMDNFSFSFFHSDNSLLKSAVFVKDVELISTGRNLKSGESKSSKTKKKPENWYEINERPVRYKISVNLWTAPNDEVLDLVEHAAFGFFWNEVSPKNGLIKDRCYAFGSDLRNVASIASVGFGLSAICVADKRGWVEKDAAYKRVLMTLKFFQTEAQMYNGFFFHYYELDTGAPVSGFEVSSVDTALFMMGVITAKQYYKGTDVETVADQLLNTVDWPWMMNGKQFLSMGYDKKFIDAEWRDYNEGLLCYILAMGSKTHAISSDPWDSVQRESLKYKDFTFVPSAGDNALFTHQYPQIWVNLKGRPDRKKMDYFENSKIATQANAAWCRDNSALFATFGQGFWGLTACDGPKGYVINGAPYGKCDGTVAPTATLGSVAFTPNLSIEQAKKYFGLKDELWGKYGFVDSFNLDKNWFSSVYLGIDLGPILLMIENYRSGMIWDLVSQEPSIQTGLEHMGFQPQPASKAVKSQKLESVPEKN